MSMMTELAIQMTPAQERMAKARAARGKSKKQGQDVAVPASQGQDIRESTESIGARLARDIARASRIAHEDDVSITVAGELRTMSFGKHNDYNDLLRRVKNQGF